MSTGVIELNSIGSSIGRLRRINLAQRLRLLSGLTMFTFATTHLLNHSFGLVSLDMMVAGQKAFFWFWHSWPLTILLLTAFATHLTLVLYKQIVRPTLRMSWLEGVRILLGLITLCVLSFHGTHQLTARLVHGMPVRYPDFLIALSAGLPLLLNQLTLVTCAWSHGCVGMHLWLRQRATYRRIFPGLLTLAVLLPVLALLGVLTGAREATVRQTQGASIESSYGYPEGAGSPSIQARGYGYGETSGYSRGTPSNTEETIWGAPAMSVYGMSTALGVITCAVLLRIAVQMWRRRAGRVVVRYPGGRQLSGPPGSSILDISRIGRMPHASVCGGRGRCSTCRVYVDEGWEHLPPAHESETRVLQRIHAPDRVRLACQLRPLHGVAVTPLVPANATPRDALPYDSLMFGVEQEIAILFADLRGFTKMSENKLPYDVVHILNQYFSAMGEAIEGAGGHLDKFIGDGIMALFGLREGVQAGAMHALAAAKAMDERLTELNRRLAPDLAQPLRLGIGIHAGHAIVGQMGYGRVTSLTAIGDAVNVASRLESATKQVQCQLLVSASAAERSHVNLSSFPLHEITVPGRSGSIGVYAIDSAADVLRSDT